jgi:hypothetical protein
VFTARYGLGPYIKQIRLFLKGLIWIIYKQFEPHSEHSSPYYTQQPLNFFQKINPLNAELNPICHLLILLGDLTFMGPCIVSIFQYISNKMQRYTVYLYLEIALHVSGGTSTHHQELIQLYLHHLVSVTPLLLSAALEEKLELFWVCCVWRTPPTAHSNHFQLFHDSGR